MEETKFTKKGFFKKFWYSIFKLEKYGEMAAEGVPRAIFYTIKLALIISVVIAICSIFQVNDMVNKGKTFLETQVGEFTYKDGILDVKKEEPIIAPSERFGQIVINTKIDTDEELNQILNSLPDSKGIVILKDGIIAKGFTSQGTLGYKYAEVLKGTNVNEANNQDVLNIISNENVWKIYLAIAIVIILYMLLTYTLHFLWNTVMLSIFGYIVTFFAKIKMRFAAVFNMACYAFTLSVFLQTIYVGLNMFIPFEIKYFQVMFVAVAAIYLIAAIFLIRAEFLKQKIESSKMVAIKKSEEIKQEENNDNKETKKPEEQEPEEKKEKTKEKKKKENDGAEPEGSQA